MKYIKILICIIFVISSLTTAYSQNNYADYKYIVSFFLEDIPDACNGPRRVEFIDDVTGGGLYENKSSRVLLTQNLPSSINGEYSCIVTGAQNNDRTTGFFVAPYNNGAYEEDKNGIVTKVIPLLDAVFPSASNRIFCDNDELPIIVQLRDPNWIIDPTTIATNAIKFNAKIQFALANPRNGESGTWVNVSSSVYPKLYNIRFADLNKPEWLGRELKCRIIQGSPSGASFNVESIPERNIFFLPKPNINLEPILPTCYNTADAKIIVHGLTQNSSSSQLRLDIIRLGTEPVNEDDNITPYTYPDLPGVPLYWNDQITKNIPGPFTSSSYTIKNSDFNDDSLKFENGYFAIKAFYYDTDKNASSSLCNDSAVCHINRVPLQLNLSALPKIGSSIYNIPINGGGCLINGSVSGNQGSYTLHYRLNSIDKTFSFNSTLFKAGTYDFWVTDSEGCKSTEIKNVKLEQPGKVDAIITPYAPNCHADNTDKNSKKLGSISVKVESGGIPNFNFYLYDSKGTLKQTIPNKPADQTNYFNDLLVDTYTVKITDQGGKVVSTKSGVSITRSRLSLMANPVDAKCYGTNGKITLSATNGSGQLSYYINNSKITGNEYSTKAGNYTCKVVDGNACYFEQKDVVVGEATQLSFSFVKAKQPTCNLSDGLLGINISGGLPSKYDYTVTLTNTTNNNFQPRNKTITAGAADRTVEFDGIPAGKYQVTASYNTTCNATSNEFNIIAQNHLSVSAPANLITPVNCSGNKDGAISLLITGEDSSNPATVSTPNYEFDGTTNTIKGLAEGTYKFSIEDDRGCTATMASGVTVGVRPDPITLTTPTITPATCSTAKNGSIVINSTGGEQSSLTYLLDGTTSKNTGSFTGLSSKQYTLRVTDGANCYDERTITVSGQLSNPVSLSMIDYNDQYCDEGNKGWIQVNGGYNGNASALTYSISPGPQNIPYQSGLKEFNNLSTDSYTIKLKDSDGCSQIVQQTISNKGYTPQVSSQVITPLACSTAQNGELQLNVKDYSGSDVGQGFTYSFTDAKGAAVTPSVDNALQKSYKDLNNQLYDLVVTDAFDCKYIANDIQIGERTDAVKLNPAVTITPASCAAAPNGTLQVSASGGIPIPSVGYRFTLLNGTTVVKSQSGLSTTFTGLSAAIQYTVKVEDAEGCGDVSDVRYQIPVRGNLLSLSNAVTTPPSCNGGNDGSIKITISNDNAPGVTYSYHIYDQNNILVNTSTFDKTFGTFSGLTAGTYRISVQGDDTCGENYDNIIVNEPTKIVISASAYQCITGNGLKNGSFTITASEGSKNYVYEWIKDGNVVTSPTDVTYNTTFGFTFEASDLTPGTYTFRLRDMNSCLYFDSGNSIWYEESFTLTEPNKLTLTPTIVHESCASANDGQISILAEGGWLCGSNYQSDCNNTSTSCGEWSGINCTNPDYIYGIVINNAEQWQCSNVFKDLNPGSYQVMVQDKAGNITSQEVTINARPLLSITEVGSSIDATCPGYSNGQVRARVTNGVLVNGTFTYTITNKNTGQLLATLNQGADFSYKQLPASEDDYTLTVTDLNGCQASFNFSIGEPKPAQIKVTHNFIRDKDQDSGEIEAIVTNGNQQFNFEWYYNGAPTPFNGATKDTITLKKLLAGTYLLKVKDIHNCVYETSEWMERTIEIIEPDKKLQFSKQESTNVSCNGFGDASISVEATGGWGTNYEYSLNNEPWQANGDYTNLEPGDYSVTIRDEEEVTRTWEVTITEPKTLDMNLSGVFNASCPLYANGRIEATILNGIDHPDGLHYRIVDLNDATMILGEKADFSRDYRFNKLPKGDYELFVTDQNSCVASKMFTINEPDTAKIKLTNNFIRAKGEATGEIDVTVSKGNGLFDYKWYRKGETTPFKQGRTSDTVALDKQLAGTYTLMLRDTARCVYEDEDWMTRIVEMREPENALKFEVTRNRATTCFEDADGSIEVLPIGGWGNYKYTLNGGVSQPETTFNNLVADNYTITITDSTGIQWDSTLVVTQPELLEAAYLNHKDINCFGGKDGWISLDIKGGNQNYLVSTDQENWIPGNRVEDLAIGTYTVFVKDKKECATQINPITLMQPHEITLVDSSIIKSRCSNNEGIINTVFKGGVGSLNYTWYRVANDYSSETLLTATNDTISDLFAGRYKVEVTDDHHCTLPFNFAIGDITDLAIDAIETKAVSCYGYSDGQALAKVINGNQPYAYSWPKEISEHQNDTAWAMTAGTYDLLVSDDKGCTTTRKFTIQTPAPLNYSLSIDEQPLCLGGQKGTIELTGTGGTPEYNYTWSTGSSDARIADLEPGTYALTLTDSHECEARFSFERQYQRYLTPFIGVDTLICHYDLLPLDAGAYNRFIWTADNGFASDERTISLNDPGTYFLEVTDVDNCLGYDTLKLDVSYLQIDDLQLKDVTCNKFADGEAHLTIRPENWEHTISWPDASNETSWMNLSGGNYKVEVKDPFGCKEERHFTIFEPDTLNLVINQLQSPLCYGNSNGIIDSRMAGGVSPYRITWNTGSQNELLTKLDTGYYHVEVYDANNCFYEQGFDFRYRRFLAPHVGPDTLICHYDKLPLDAGDYSKFRWTARGNFSSRQREVTLTDPDTYYLEVTDADNCLGYDTLKLEVSYLKIDNLQLKDVTCYGFGDGEATITVSPAHWPHTISWPDGSGLNSWRHLNGGTYEVNIADAFGCGDKDYFKIDEPAPLAINMNKQLDPYCFGVPDGIIETEGNGGVANYRYNWLHGENNRKIEKLDTGRYVLDLFDGNNCHIREAFNMHYVKTIYPQLGNDLVICQGNNAKLYPGAFEAYQWFQNDIETGSDTALVISDAATYRVQVADDFGCVGRDTMSLELRATDLVPEFLTATSVPAGDTLIIVEVSQPKPNKIEWFFTGEYQVVETGAYYCKVIFTEEGMREVTLNAHSYNCFAQARKTILVTPAGSAEGSDNPAEQGYTNLMKITASPNPSDGFFNVDVTLSEEASINIYLVSLGSGKILDQRKGRSMKIYNESFNLSIPGPYVVIVESGGERRVTKVIIK